MRDELDARYWVDHHDQFSEWLEGRIAAAGAAARRAVRVRRHAFGQLLSLVAAVGITLASFGGTAA